MALSFLLVGYAFQWMLKKIKMLDELTNRYAVGGTLILFGFLMSMKHGGYISQINSYLYISGAICTIIGFYILSNIFVKCKLLQNIGKNSLYILGLHVLSLGLSNNFANFIAGCIGLTNAFLINVMTITCSISICCGLAEIYKEVKQNILYR